MQQATFDSCSIDIKANPSAGSGQAYTFRATGQTIKFDGFLKVYPTKFEEMDLPNLKEKEILELKELSANQHFTQPPSRYSEATLIKVLEKSFKGFKFKAEKGNKKKIDYSAQGKKNRAAGVRFEAKVRDNLEKMVIKIDGKSKYSFEILNPLYQKMELTNNSEHVETYSLILLKFLEFSQLIDLNKYKLGKITKEELYIEFISNVFNEYMKNNEKNILEWDFIIPSFFKEDKFKINIDLISNKETVNYIKSSDKIEYVFKCILGSFNKPKKKPVGVFNEITLENFNVFVDKLDRIIDKALKTNREYELQKDDLKNFKDYFNLKYNVDSQGELYPDVYSEFGEETGGEKNKKKKGMKEFDKGFEPKGFDPFDKDEIPTKKF